jgi:hypothetical protein
MSSNRSKRRKVRKELNNIKSLYSTISTNEPLESIVIVNCEKEITKPNDGHSPITTAETRIHKLIQ